jgi:hypothetical protein
MEKVMGHGDSRDYCRAGAGACRSIMRQPNGSEDITARLLLENRSLVVLVLGHVWPHIFGPWDGDFAGSAAGFFNGAPWPVFALFCTEAP